MIDYATAKAFLDRLSWPNTIQTYDDAGKGRQGLVRVIHCQCFENVASELARLNDLGAGIFVTVNATDGRGRKKENIIRVRAVFVDADCTASPRGWHKCPNILVYRDAPETESARAGNPLCRWHAYWLANDVPLDQFSSCQRRLAKHYGTDPAIHDLPRVMRVPGFIHRKGEPQEVYCHIQERTEWI